MTARLPTHIKLMRGTDRSGGLANEPHQPQLTTVPDPPDSLGDVGVEKWLVTGEHLRSLGLLEQRYIDGLEIYCRAWDRLVGYEAVLEKEGEFKVTDKGFWHRHPAAAAAAQARDEIRRYQILFGMTPASSASVKTAPTGSKGVRTRQRA